jgi:putative FmdB family regulatory protein
MATGRRDTYRVAMATYEYLCLACEHPFEERRPMSSGPVGTALACPSCGSERVRRRFSFSAATGGAVANANDAPAGGGCCGGACGCGN